MTTTLVFHTLQNARHNFALSHSDPSQPDLLGLVAALHDDDAPKVPLEKMTAIITLDEGKGISEESFRMDGIGERMMHEHGVPLHIALDKFADMAKRADRVAAFSVEHHVKTVLAAATITEVEMPTVSMMCLMKKSTIPCKLPTRTAGTYKMPKLVEAYHVYTKQDFVIPYSASAQEILDYHLNARSIVFQGIRKWEDGELKKAAKPVAKNWAG